MILVNEACKVGCIAMMTSPEVAAEEHKNDTFEQLITERHSCYLELKELKKIVFDEKKTDPEWNVHPGPDVRYQWSLEYMAELCKLMQDKYCSEVVYRDEELE